MQFYSELVDGLLAAGIEPLVTLYHWDLPVWIHEKGGWSSEAIIPLFEAYTHTVVETLSDRVKWWMSMNEPQCFIPLGYQYGVHAPFKRNFYSLSRVTRICMLAHAASVKTIRRFAKLPPKVGIAMAAGAFIPENESAEAVEKAKKQSFANGSIAASLPVMGRVCQCGSDKDGEIYDANSDSHEAIISDETFKAVQQEKIQRSNCLEHKYAIQMLF